MDSASRHARRIANSFLDDLDHMQRTSRNNDRRAMSHFETSSYTPYSTMEIPRRRIIQRESFSTSRSHHVPEYTRRIIRESSAMPSFYQAPEEDFESGVHLVGKVYTNPYSTTSNIRRVIHSRPEVIEASDYPTLFSGNDHIGTVVCVRPILVRAQSIPSFVEGVDEEIPVQRTIRRSVVSSRLGSVPPPATYMYSNDARITSPRIYSSALPGLPPRAPSRMMTSSYVTREIPSVMSTSYSMRHPEVIVEPIHSRRLYTPIYRSHYTGPPSGYTSRLYSAGSYNDLTSERLRRVNRRLDDDMMEYKPLEPEYFRKMRGSLSSLNDKISQHKKLIDRYSGIDMTPTNESVLDRVNNKYRELTDRGMGRV